MTIPHCPNRKCSNFNHPDPKHQWYRKKGFEVRKLRGTIQRYQCKSCHRTFDLNYFSMDFYLHRKISYKSIFHSLITCSGIRDMARHFHCTTKVIQNRIRRLSQKIMILSSQIISQMELKENLAADGLESFILSQYFPSNINILAGSRSQFIYYHNAYYFKRKGKTTREQKKKLKELYKEAFFEKGGASRAFRELLITLEDLLDRSDLDQMILDTDENPIYSGQFKAYGGLHSRVTHRLTNSKEERNQNNKLFPCNYIDRQIRKDMAEHVRETVQYARNMNPSMERFAIYRFWHNFMKPFREKHRRKGYGLTHGEVAGISRERIMELVSRVMDGRRILLDPDEVPFTSFQRRVFDGELPNPLRKAAV